LAKYDNVIKGRFSALLWPPKSTGLAFITWRVEREAIIYS